MPEQTGFDVSAEDYEEYVEGENADAIKPIQVEVVGPLVVRQFPARSWSGQVVTIDTGVQQIAGRLAQRKKLSIVNNGANSVWLAPTREACSVTAGLEITTGPVGITMEHSGEVFAVADTALPTRLSIYAEFRDGGV